MSQAKDLGRLRSCGNMRLAWQTSCSVWQRNYENGNRRPSNLLNFSLPSPGTKETNEHDPHSEPGKFRSAAQIAGSAESDLLTAPSALREMLKKNDYRMALVSGAGADYRGGPDAEQFSIPTSAVLWPFSWNELVLGLRESLRDSGPVAESSSRQLWRCACQFHADGSEALLEWTRHSYQARVQGAGMFRIESRTSAVTGRIAE